MANRLEQQEEAFHLGMKALIQNKEGNILLLEKHPENKGGMHWDLPGGRVQKNEAFEEALKREVYEETGLRDLTDLCFFNVAMTARRIATAQGSVKLALMFYLCKVLEPTPVCLSREHVGFKWVSPQEVQEWLSPPFFPKEFIEKISHLSIRI